MDSKDREQFGMPTTPQTGIFSNPNSLSTPTSNGGGALASNPQAFPQPSVVVSNQEDIILSDRPNNTKKKIAIIGIVCLFIVILVVCAAIFLIPHSKKAAFNQYANMLLYGTESNEDIGGEYVWGYRYYARAIDNIHSDSYNDYLDKLKTKYEYLYRSTAIPDEYNDAFWLFYYISYYPDINLRDVKNADNDLSEQEVKQKISEYYAPFLAASNVKVNEYGDYKIKTLTEEGHDELSIPNYEIIIFKDIWEMKGDI